MIIFLFVDCFIALDFVQPVDLIFPVLEANCKVNIRLDKYQFGEEKFKTIWLQADVINWKDELLKNFTSANLKFVHFNSEEFDVIIEDKDLDCFSFHGTEVPNTKIFTATNFMWFKVFIKEAPTIGLYEAFKADLTKVGSAQMSIFEKQLLEISRIFLISKAIYAPFTSLIQSSGSGKSKICTEVLIRNPGIYLVFRAESSSGIPKQASWIDEFVKFVFKSGIDELPADLSELENSLAKNFTPSRFLLALHAMIVEYFLKFQQLQLEGGYTREEAIEIIGKNFMKKPSATVAFFDPEFHSSDSRTIIEVVKDILYLINGCPNSDGDNFYGINSNSIKLLMSTNDSSEFPFLVFLDEADFLNVLTSRGRVPGVHVVRRALHLLGNNAKLLVVAIGTNSDVLDFTASVQDNSLRYVTRKDLLPPLTICCNWDIFSEQFPIEDVEVSEELLRNPSTFKVLVSMGRPLWSSCNLDLVVSTCVAKLKNGNPECLASLMALLLVRANSSVNVHHILARSLVRSYMALVNYVSTDGLGLKMCYSSEPILAIASRNCLSFHKTRESAFKAMKEFIEMQAIDKGRIVENIFEHFALFALDDAKAVNLKNEKITEDPKYFPEQIEHILKCKNYILELQEPRPVEVINIKTSSFLFDDYRLVRVGDYLSKYIGLQEFSVASQYISLKILNSYMNATHFVNLERMKNDFKNLKFSLKKNQDSGQNVIDRSILKCGLMRQCGFVLPPNYYAFDKYFPILLGVKSERPIYSFIGFQSKSSTVVIHDCAAKMAANLHVVKCPIHNKSKFECTDEFQHKESSVYTDDDLVEIFENNLVILETFENTGPKTFSPSKTLALNPKLTKGKSLKSKAILRKSTLELPKFNLMKEQKQDLKDAEIEIVSFPKFDKLSLVNVPDLIITNNLKRNLSIQQMSWEKGTRSLTCIAINDISHMQHLVTPSTIEIVREIVNHTPSVFDAIDPFHLEMVQKSTLNGRFCNYSYCNPTLCKMRGINPIQDPIENYFKKLNITSLNGSLQKCSVGVVNFLVPQDSERERDDFDEKETVRDVESFISESESEQRAESISSAKSGGKRRFSVIKALEKFSPFNIRRKK